MSQKAVFFRQRKICDLGQFRERQKSEEFRYAGNIRLLPEVYERVRDMKNVFDVETYVTFQDKIYKKVKDMKNVFNGEVCSCYFWRAEAEFEFRTKNSLYQTLIVRTAFLQGMPIVCLYAQSEIKIFMHPSDINKISFLLKYTPDDLIKWAHREGFLDKEEAETFLELEIENFSSLIRHPIEICDRFAYRCAEIELLNGDDQDEEWVDVIR